MTFYIRFPFQRELFVERRAKLPMNYFSFDKTENMLYRDTCVILLGISVIWSRPNVRRRKRLSRKS